MALRWWDSRVSVEGLAGVFYLRVEGGWVGLPSSVQPSEVGKRFHPSPP